MKKINTSMTEGPLFRGIVLYTIPIILTGILQLLFNAADLVVVGRFCGSVSVGAVGATGAITTLVVSLFTGLSVGSGVTVAHAYGQKDWKTVHRTVHTTLPLAIASGLVLTVIGVLFSKQLLMLMDTPENVLELSSVYMKIYFAGMTFNMIYNFAAAILRAVGDTKSPLIFLTLAGVINVILNLIFVTVFHMNVAGVALATTLSQGVSAFLVVRELMKRTDACRLVLRDMRFYGAQIKKIVFIGLPSGINGAVYAISNVLIQSSVNSFGDIVVSGNAAAGNIEGFVWISINSFMQSALNYTAQNVGAGNFNRVKKTFWTCLASVSAVGIFLGVTVYSLAPHLLSIYITDSAEAIAYGITRMTYICLPYFLCGIMDVTTGALRGMGVSFAPMIISIMGVCGIRIGWIYTIFRVEEFHTLDCLYFSYPISWIITFSVQLAVYLIILKKRTKKAESLVETI